MMDFTVYANNDLIYNRRVIDEHGNAPYLILDPVLDETTDSFCSLTYRAKRGTPAYDLSVEMVPRIKVYEDGNLYWSGRVLKSAPTINGEKEIYVEDFLGVLCDGIYRPFEYYGTADGLLRSIVDANNSQVGASQQIYDVVCDVDVGNIVRSSESYATCWQTIKEKLLDMIGGYIWVEYDQAERAILHYSLSARNASTQTIAFGENLVSSKVEYNFDSFYTAIVPLGAKDADTKEYITIESVNDGNDYLIDETNAARFGIIFAPTSETTWDDVHEPSILLARAQSWLQNKSSRLIQQIELSAHDLSGLNADLRAFHWLDSVHVTSNEIDGNFVIKNLRRPLDKPLQITIAIGDVRSSLTGATVSKQSSTLKRIAQIEEDYVLNADVGRIIDGNVNPKIEAIQQELLTETTSIRQEANQIILSALQEYAKTSSVEELYEMIASQLSILADRVEANFISTNESVSNIDGTYRAEINTILSFIRLLPTTATQEGGVVIGESTSEIKLKLENDVLYFFTGDETTVSTQNAIAYFAAGQLVVNEAVLRVVSVGIPGAMMHFSIVGSGSLQCLFLSPRRVD